MPIIRFFEGEKPQDAFLEEIKAHDIGIPGDITVFEEVHDGFVETIVEVPEKYYPSLGALSYDGLKPTDIIPDESGVIMINETEQTEPIELPVNSKVIFDIKAADPV